MTKEVLNGAYAHLLNEVKARASSSRHQAILNINKELTLLYHHIGRAILDAQNKAKWALKSWTIKQHSLCKFGLQIKNSTISDSFAHYLKTG